MSFRRGGSQFLAVALGVSAVALACAGAAGAAARTVPVVRCPTVSGLPLGKVRLPHRLAVLGAPASVSGLAAYTNTDIYLVAPAGMACSGAVAVDGGERLTVWARGHRVPTQRARYAALTLWLDPACLGCKADDGCPFFPQFARLEHVPCDASLPSGEHVVRPSSNVALFSDPPGVAGSGWPSGGPDAAYGVVGIHGNFSQGAVYRSTCTLPRARIAACTVSRADVRARYG